MPLQDIHSEYTDDLSPLGRELLMLDIDRAYTRLVVEGDGNAQALAMLDGTIAGQLLASPPSNEDDARAMLAAFWLYHDFLDRSHTISQSLENTTGSFWHAIMHRREGDFSNSKYWYARCRNHPVLAVIGQYANSLLAEMPADKRLLRIVHGGWNPNAFIDLVEEIHNRPGEALHGAAVSLQQAEWRILFDHCARSAAGK